MKQDLELASTDDLLDEILRRFDTCVFAGLKVERPNVETEEYCWFGHSLACTGLTANLQAKILRDYNTNRRLRKGKS